MLSITLFGTDFFTSQNQNKKCNLSCCKLQGNFRSNTKLSNMFRFKDHISYNLVSGVVYE